MSNQLVGHSGCSLEIRDKTVRKTSFSLDYNERLKSQYNKQMAVLLGNFKQTRVHSHGVSSQNLFFFDMDFIPGQTLAYHLKDVNLAEIKHLCTFFSDLYNPQEEFFPKAVFDQKIQTLKSTFSPAALKEHESSFKILENYDWEIEKNAVCHGDLTLENIIIFNHDLYMIDLLDSFCESWMIDIAKILQDLETYWSYRDEGVDLNQAIRLETFKIELYKQLVEKGLTLKQFKNCYHLLLLNLLRIIPYIKNDKSEGFLRQGIQKIKNKLPTLDNEYENINRSLRR